MLTNLSTENGINERLFNKHNIHEILQALILEHFVDKTNNSQNNQENKLSELQLSLLENVLWLTGNLSVDFAYILSSDRLAE